VLRLFSEAYFINEKLDAGGLWSISRGLALYKKEYYERLSNADNPRLNDYDGRGVLSERYLTEFCIFFLKVAIDQVKFMTGLFEVDTILKRIEAFTALMVTREELRPESEFLLREIFLTGRVSKGDVSRITGKSDNIARAIMNSLLEMELIKTETDDFRSGLVINFPAKYAPYFFPKLYPPDIEATLIGG
jgi:Fic family protein